MIPLMFVLMIFMFIRKVSTEKSLRERIKFLEEQLEEGMKKSNKQ